MSNSNQYTLIFSFIPAMSSSSSYPIENIITIIDQSNWIVMGGISILPENPIIPIKLLAFTLHEKSLTFSYSYPSTDKSEVPITINVGVKVPEGQKQLQLSADINTINTANYQVANSGTPPIQGGIETSSSIVIPLTKGMVDPASIQILTK